MARRARSSNRHTALDRLDAFEGAQYNRIVIVLEGVQAYTDVLSREWLHITDGQPWNPGDLTPAQLRRFL